MSTFWTTETVTLVERTYIRGTFQGKYHAQRSEADSSHHAEYFRMHIYQAEVTIGEVRKNKEFPETAGLRDFEGSFAQPVNCCDPGTNTFFQLHIHEPMLSAITLSRVVREGAENFGTISGTLYGYVTKLHTEQRKVAHDVPDPVTLPITGNVQQWSRTPTHEFSYREGTRYRRDYYRHSSGSFRWGEWYAVEQPWTFRSVLRVIFGFAFLGLAIFLLFSLSWAGLLILGFVFLLLFFRRSERSGIVATIFSGFYGLILLFFLFCLGIGLYQGFTRNRPVHAVNPPNTKRNYSTTKPLKHTANADAWIIHHRAWQDINGNSYEGDVRVLKSAFLQAQRGQEQLAAASSFADVYKALATGDAQHLSGVYALFDSLKNARQPDSLGFAGMLVSFVQDIPYSSVNAGDCSSQNYNDISGPAANDNANCIGHIPFGVQSPVEFMANFQGDCDTRTLFLFTLFDHYHYPAAILSSIAFRHSLLGLKLPLPGSSKNIGTQRYVLWETTSKGFAPGQLSPQVDNMDYWDFTLINTPNI
ncbi:MAG: hypothetical protein M3O71_15670 [Bacteroidota bacterium]|nr:hypothetical protein [Bacteroidota bacterium]